MRTRSPGGGCEVPEVVGSGSSGWRRSTSGSSRGRGGERSAAAAQAGTTVKKLHYSIGVHQHSGRECGTGAFQASVSHCVPCTLFG